MYRATYFVALLAGVLVGLMGAGRSGPGMAAHQGEPAPDGHEFVGSWRLSFLEGPAIQPGLATFHADGTFLMSILPVVPAGPGLDRVLHPSPCHGTWAAAGQGSSIVTCVTVYANSDGTHQSTATITATFQHDPALGAFGGGYRVKIVDPDGTTLAEGGAPIVGEPIVAEWDGTPVP